MTRSASRVLVDLSDCTFIDSTVIATLLTAMRDAVAGGDRFAIVLPPQASSVQRIVAITKLDEVSPLWSEAWLINYDQEAAAALWD
jgi:anti-anti-sigma factor